MSGLLSVVGVIGLLVAVVGMVKGTVTSVGLTSRSASAKAAAAALVMTITGGALAPDPRPATDSVGQDGARRPAAAAGPTTEASPRTAPPEPAATTPPAVTTSAPVAPAPRPAKPQSASTAPAAAPLLVMAAGGDGDSWRDTAGVEYRMGLINAPETDECGGAAATAYRRRALVQGFRARAYATDGYGRKVSVILAPDGGNLNVAMARDGIADDRYLGRFRHENPGLAAELDVAFGEARAARRGIWGTCAGHDAGSGAAADRPAQAPQPVAGRCHPDYETCIQIVGDGSGRGAVNDLDCGEIGHVVHLRQVGRDPYRLDGNDRDGVGCE